MKITLADELEKALLHAVTLGTIGLESLTPDELSDSGKRVLRAIRYLFDNGAKPPLGGAAVVHAAVDMAGAERVVMERYVREVEEISPGSDAQALIKAAHNKKLLVGLVNEAGTQLTSGAMDVGKLSEIIRESEDGTVAEENLPVAQMMDTYLDPPVGLPLKSLPNLTEATGGLMGLWIIGGLPKLGKSTLTYQIALEASQTMDVLYYDLDGTGIPWLIDRTRKIYMGDEERMRKATQRLFIRPDAETLEFDLMRHAPPSLVVLDSVQTLPMNVAFRTSALDKWIIRCKEMTKQGYVVLLVSEINIDGDYKHSGELKYAGNVCIRLERDSESDSMPVDVNVRYNRHRPKTGVVTSLMRDEHRIWFFKEIL